MFVVDRVRGLIEMEVVEQEWREGNNGNECIINIVYFQEIVQNRLFSKYRIIPATNGIVEEKNLTMMLQNC